MPRRNRQDRNAIIRRITPSKLELRAVGDGPGQQFTGYAAVFDSYSGVLWDWWEGSFIEQIAPGAFAKTIQEADVRLLINHDANLLLARNKAGTMTLTEDAKGLLVTADLAPTTIGQDIAISLQRGDINQMSFAFRVVKDEWSTVPTGPLEGMPLRTLKEVSLQNGDVSIVTYPAYEETEAGCDAGDGEDGGDMGEMSRVRQFYGMARGLGLTEMPAEQRNALLSDLARGQVAPERLPALQAAHQALGALLRTSEPLPEQHSPVVAMDVVRRRLALAARDLAS